MTHQPPVYAESRFEDEIVEVLKAIGWTQGDSTHYDKIYAAYPSELLAFLTATQADSLSALRERFTSDSQIAAQVRRAINEKGLSRALLHGIDVGEAHLTLMFTRPAHGLNPEAERLYGLNRLMVVRQLKYSCRNENSIDLVLFLNGLPIITVELKSEFNQSVDKAIAQYCEDRNPRGEPLLTIGTGALVHFAIDQAEAHMTTALAGRTTKFLPFNRFSESGKVNPLPPGVTGHPSSHVWCQVWEPSALLHILKRYVTQEPCEREAPRPNDNVIFPRYHQWEASQAIVLDVTQKGPGQRYLIQHSPGSGKSNTIGWTAHELAELHNASAEKMFSSVVLLTDRVVLDRQTDETAGLLQRFAGTAQHARDTRHLVELLTAGCPVVVSTIQKFAHIFKEDLEEDLRKKWQELTKKNYAVVIDEAHSSQNGDYHAAMKRHLESYKGRNLTYIAFTATPKDETLAIFGTDDGTGQKKPFHVYSLYQALTEKFILDVLQNYYPVKSAYCLVVNGEDKLVQASEAGRLLLTSIGQDVTAIEEKVRIIGWHFHERIASSLGGRGKAMVVTSSRLAALRYHRLMKEFFRAQKLPYQCLVAYSDAVYEPLDEVHYRENDANELPINAEVAQAFKNDQQRILIVADKYQTGFNQPLLNAMYIDKVLANDISAVQTLSRLNRLFPQKSAPFILDFVNNEVEVREAFQKYQGKVELEKYEGMPALLALAEVIWSFKVYEPDLIDDIYEELSYRGNASEARIGELIRGITAVVEEFDAEHRQQFKSVNSKFVAQYELASKIDHAPPFELKKLYSVCRLVKKLWAAKGTPGSPKESLSVLIAEMQLGEKIAFASVNPEAPYVTAIDGTVRMLSQAEHEDILLSSFIADANAESMHGDTAALYTLLVAAVEALSTNAQIKAEASGNSFDSFIKASAQRRFKNFLGQSMVRAPKDQVAFAQKLMSGSSDGRAFHARAFRAVARCVFNRAVF